MKPCSRSFLLVLAACVWSASAVWEDFPHLLAAKEDPTLDTNQPLEFTTQDIITFAVASCLIMIAAGGGIGGGGVLVPTYIFILGFEPQYAIPLSNATILGSSLANLMFNVWKRHPQADRPLIDWDIMLVMEPLTVLGALVGSFINVLSPPWLICILLVLLLSATTVKSYKKGFKMYAKETKAMQLKEGQLQCTESGALKKGLVNDCDLDVMGDLPPANQLQEALEKNNYTLFEILKEEQRTQLWKVLMMFMVTGGMLVLTILKGGGEINPLNIQCGSLPYWGITLAAIPLVLGVSVIARNHLVKVYHKKKTCGFEYVEGDVEWNERNTVRYPLICSIAGLCAGMFGIGGGIVKGPLMLEMGVLPEVCSATSATMILFTSAAATASYLLFESLNAQYGAFVFCLGFVNTLIGQKALNVMVKKYGRSSIIVLLIATIVCLSAVAMGLESGGTLIDLINGKASAPKSICGAGAA